MILPPLVFPGGTLSPVASVLNLFTAVSVRLASWPYQPRLGWKGLPETNALAYYEKSSITDVKSFITLTPGSVFTTLHFIHNLRMGPRVLHYPRLERLLREQYSGFVDKNIDYVL